MRTNPKMLLCLTTFFLATAPAIAQSKMEVTSAAFAPGKSIPTKFTCAGDDVSPPLSWSGVPQSAKSLALIMDDPDAPGGTFVHWVLYNLPPRTTHLDEDVAKEATLRSGGEQAVNGFGNVGYGGPCPPAGSPHHYRFKLFALDKELTLHSPKAAKVEQAISGHTLANAMLVGTFGR